MSADGGIQDNTDNTDNTDITGANEGHATSGPEPKPGRLGADGPDQEAATETSRPSEAQANVPEGVLPNKAAEDDPRRWGDQPDNYDHDAWLQEQKPPHWG